MACNLFDFNVTFFTRKRLLSNANKGQIRMKFKKLAAIAAFATLATSAMAGAIHDVGLFTGNTLARNDDGSTGLVNIGFSAKFFSTTQTALYVNNNGNVTFNSALTTYTPFGLTGNSFPIIAPFLADVDTTSPTSGVTQYGANTLGGRKVFGVNWIGVGYFNSQADKLNSFQLILTERLDTGAGNFDIEFNYDKILWETGSASGGSGGFGGTPAAVGYTDGGVNDFEFTGSRVTRAFLDSNPTGLIYGSRNSSTPGQYIFNVRNGIVIDPPTNGIPEPESLALVGLALAGMVILRRRQSAKTK
jgi:Nidogen-like/PEP-CTERM motif